MHPPFYEVAFGFYAYPIARCMSGGGEVRVHVVRYRVSDWNSGLCC